MLFLFIFVQTYNLMAFKKGNKIWMLRESNGSQKRLSVQDIWDHFVAYTTHIDDNPWTKTDYKGKDAEPVVYEFKAPYTWNGFDNYLFEHDVIDNLDDYRYNYSKTYGDYIPLISRIDKIIFDYKMVGATLNFFNVGIIAKELGLISKQEIASTVNVLNLGTGINPDASDGQTQSPEYTFKPEANEYDDGSDLM